ncbi:MAG: hypothetical protein JNN03_10205 [Rubrivivax sp.]|nr:hypothetical protein [Rubrivivax sp.]
MQPLTHHEIIGLVEPFSRRGRHVDLGASQRLERRLVFKPVMHGPQVPGATLLIGAAQEPSGRAGETGEEGTPGLRETLTLEQPYEDTFKLTRELRFTSGPHAGLVARLHAEGPDAGVLLQHIEDVAPRRQFSLGEGFVAALSFRMDVGATSADLLLVEAVAQVPGYTLTMRVPRVKGVSADVELAASTPGSGGTLPGDLLAVIGWDWAPLDARRDFWQSKVRLRGGAQQRSAGAEAKLQRTLQHLAHTLARPPGEFHDRHKAARFGVVFRRGIPLLTVIGMFAGVAALPRMDLDEVSPLRMFAFHLPTLLLAIAFTMQELPRFEIPPWPRRLKMAGWTTVPAAAPSPPQPDTATPMNPLEPTR